MKTPRAFEIVLESMARLAVPATVFALLTGLAGLGGAATGGTAATPERLAPRPLAFVENL